MKPFSSSSTMNDSDNLLRGVRINNQAVQTWLNMQKRGKTELIRIKQPNASFANTCLLLLKHPPSTFALHRKEISG